MQINDRITDRAGLRELYREPNELVANKAFAVIDEMSAAYIDRCPFIVISTSNGGDSMDASPRGGPPGFLQRLDDRHIAIPDLNGNNRLDTLENILANDEVGLLLLVPGVDETLRVNGRAEVRVDPDLLERFAENGKLPASVLVVTVREAFLHCAKALMRSRLWDPSTRIERSMLPSLGQMLRDQVGEGPAESQEEMVARYHETMT